MRFEVRTRVAPPPAAVYPVFGEAAFVESVAPRWLGLEVLSIGLALHDRIHVRIRGVDWVSEIVSLQRTPTEIRFVDRSTRLPWPLASFVHHHGFESRGGGTVIVDAPCFEVAPRVLAPIVYPLLYLSFLLRRRAYRRRFGRA